MLTRPDGRTSVSNLFAMVTFFKSPEAFRSWLRKHHEAETELLVGYYKKGTGRASITWPESVDEALCYGWIDGIRRRIDEESYSIRFTPRKASSTWSRVNIERMAVLQAEGRVRPAGAAAFARRKEKSSEIYAYEQGEEVDLEPEQWQRFRADPTALEFFESQAPWYRRKAIWWIRSAKKQETRDRRLEKLIALSTEGKRLM